MLKLFNAFFVSEILYINESTNRIINEKDLRSVNGKYNFRLANFLVKYSDSTQINCNDLHNFSWNGC